MTEKYLMKMITEIKKRQSEMNDPNKFNELARRGIRAGLLMSPLFRGLK